MTTMLQLKDLVPTAGNSVNTKFILLEKGNMVVERKEKMCLAFVADETASVYFQLWGDECEAFEHGDIICLSNGIFSYYKKNLVLRGGKRGSISKVGEFTMSFVEVPNMSETQWISDPGNPKKLIQKPTTSHQ